MEKRPRRRHRALGAPQPPAPPPPGFLPSLGSAATVTPPQCRSATSHTPRSVTRRRGTRGDTRDARGGNPPAAAAAPQLAGVGGQGRSSGDWIERGGRRWRGVAVKRYPAALVRRRRNDDGGAPGEGGLTALGYPTLVPAVGSIMTTAVNDDGRRSSCTAAGKGMSAGCGRSCCRRTASLAAAKEQVSPPPSRRSGRLEIHRRPPRVCLSGQ